MGVGIACGLIPVFPAMAQIAKYVLLHVCCYCYYPLFYRKVDPECSPEMINGVISGVISSTMSFGLEDLCLSSTDLISLTSLLVCTCVCVCVCDL